MVFTLVRLSLTNGSFSEDRKDKETVKQDRKRRRIFTPDASGSEEQFH